VTIRITYQGPGTDQGNPSGDGLALRLARDLTEEMGGAMRCGQTPDGGHNVTIALPAASRPHPTPSSERSPAR
jgi:signal transduction histidine kinase